MYRLLKTTVYKFFPGTVGFFTACIVIEPSVILPSMTLPHIAAVGLMLAAGWAAVIAIAIRGGTTKPDPDAFERRIASFPAE